MTNIVERNRASLAAAIAPEQSDPAVKRFSALAAELGIVLHIGSLALKAADGKIANRALIFGRKGELLGRYDKIHLFDVDLPNGESWRESAVYHPGDRARRRRPAVAQARRLDLLRHPLPAALPRRGACRRGGADRARGLHPADRRSALARAAAGARHRERRLRHLRRTGRPPRRRPRDFRPFDDRRRHGARFSPKAAARARR